MIGFKDNERAKYKGVAKNATLGKRFYKN